MKKLANVLLVSAIYLFILKCASAHGSNNSPIVNTDCGLVQGAIDNYGAYGFKGIRYAVPPSNFLRWVQPRPWTEGLWCRGNNTKVHEALDFGYSCPQVGCEMGDCSEDCLFLNVWSKELTPKTLKPVMVYIHGGALMFGSGSQDYSILSNLTAQTGVVSVSINYRLNAFGFLALSELSKQNPWGTSGNYGFYDQIMALKWVQANIASFGGDPERVTIFGDSSGGTSVLVLIASQLAEGLFHRAIAMSASVAIDATLAEASKANVGDFVNNTRCQGMQGHVLMQCLYSLSSGEIVGAITPYWNGPYDFGIPYRGEQRKQLAIVDGYLLTDSLSDILASGNVNDVPLIFGAMHEEVDLNPMELVEDMSKRQYQAFIMQRFSAWGSDFGDEVLAVYPINNYNSMQQSYDVIASDIRVICGNLMNARLAALSFDSPVYFYISTQYPALPVCFSSSYCARYAFHGWDLLGLVDHTTQFYNLTAADYPYRNELQHYFVEFATNGYLTDWKVFDSLDTFPDDYVVKVMAAPGDDDAISMKSRECSFWERNDMLKYSWSGN